MNLANLNQNDTGPCGFCGAEAIVKCARCKAIYYCDRNCQKRHWKEHKKVCKNVDGVSKKDIPLVEPLEAVDVSNLTLKVQVSSKYNEEIGVFATDFIKKGEKVCFYDGVTKDANTKVRLRKEAGSR